MSLRGVWIKGALNWPFFLPESFWRRGCQRLRVCPRWRARVCQMISPFVALNCSPFSWQNSREVVCSMVSRRTQNPDLRPRDEVLETVRVDTLNCWIYPGLQHIALSFTLSCWTLWGPFKPCLLIYFVVRLLLLFLHQCLWLDLWDVCLTETDVLFKMRPTMILCKIGTMHSTNKTSRNSWNGRSLEVDTGFLRPGIIILD